MYQLIFTIFNIAIFFNKSVDLITIDNKNEFVPMLKYCIFLCMLLQLLIFLEHLEKQPRLLFQLIYFLILCYSKCLMLPFVLQLIQELKVILKIGK